MKQKKKKVATFDNLHYAAAGSMCEPYISSDPVTKYFHDNLLMVSKKKKKLTSYKERKISIKSIVTVVWGY